MTYLLSFRECKLNRPSETWSELFRRLRGVATPNGWTGAKSLMPEVPGGKFLGRTVGELPRNFRFSCSDTGETFKWTGAEWSRC